jgi:SAM-dependent methyltransferase
MGINREFAALLVELRRRGALGAVASVVELGAQEISAEPSAIGRILNEARIGAGEPIATARALYESFGCTRYCAIDASGGADVLTFDLNRDLARDHDFHETFDLVTNLGTLEHCFNQAAGFENMHRLCRPGGLMIHCLPTQGLVNHGFYNYHPRFVADLASANG